MTGGCTTVRKCLNLSGMESLKDRLEKLHLPHV